MQGAQKLYDTTLANISRWKCGFGAIAALALGSAPPLIGGRPMHHGFYSTPVGVAIALIAGGILALLGLILLLCVLLTIFTSPRAVWLDGGDLKWGRIGTKRIALTEIRAVSFDAALSRVRLDRRDNGKPEYIPTLGLRSVDAPGPLVEKLRQLIRAT
jgi:hypothetical protein